MTENILLDADASGVESNDALTSAKLHTDRVAESAESAESAHSCYSARTCSSFQILAVQISLYQWF